MQGGGIYACADGTAWVKGFTPAVRRWQNPRGHPPQSLPVYCLSRQGDKLMKRPVADAFVMIDKNGVRVMEGNSGALTITVKPYSRPNFEKAIRAGGVVASAAPPKKAPVKSNDAKPAVSADVAPADPDGEFADDPEVASVDLDEGKFADDEDPAAPVKSGATCTNDFSKSLAAEKLVDCSGIDEGKMGERKLLIRFLNGSPEERRKYQDILMETAAAAASGDPDDGLLEAKKNARRSSATSALISRAKQELCPPASAAANQDCRPIIINGKHLAVGQRECEAFKREAEVRIAALAQGQDSKIAEECRDAKMQAPLTSPGGKPNIAGNMPPAPDDAASESGFLDKWGKPIGAGIGALAGLGIFLAIGGGPLGLLAIGGLAAAGWFAGGAASKAGSFFSSSAPPSTSAPASSSSESQHAS